MSMAALRASTGASAPKTARNVVRVARTLSAFACMVVQKRISGRPASANVVPMPVGDDSVVAQFLRYHVLVRRFGGDPDAWLAQLDGGESDGGDLRFVRWIRSRLRQDPGLMTSIRAMVEATPFWRVAEA
jgi:hypothetical protein